MVIALIVFILVFVGLDVGISLLNYNQRTQPLPANVAGIYDEAAYSKWLAYSMEKLKLGLIQKAVVTLILVGFLGLGGFAWLNTFSESFSTDPVLTTLIFIGAFMGLQLVVGLPFEWVDTFTIEAKYGFNKTTVKTFWIDQLKGSVLGVVLGGAVLTLLVNLYLNLKDALLQFGIWAYVALSILTLAMFVLSKVFVRFFNRLKPIDDAELKGKIDELATKCGFRVKSIYEMDASKRSTKLNGFYTGFGKVGEIVLYDTLIAKMSHEQILAVLAHELGHAKHKDTQKLLAIQNGTMVFYIALIVFILYMPGLFTPFGFEGVHFGFALILFSILVEPLSLVLGIVRNALMRIAETKADAYAVSMTSKETMGDVLKTLAAENFSNLNPHPLYVMIHYTHPPIAQRLSDLQKAN
jgi:STE24 endopeptidase